MTDDTGITNLGQALIRLYSRACPMIYIMPMGCRFRNCHEAWLTWRRFRDPSKPRWWRDWYIPWNAPRVVLWTKGKGFLPRQPRYTERATPT
jgi:hypothetical protein